jgi:transposase
MGQRVKRGLFSSSKHVYLNADINGAINIMRKLIDIKDIENNKKIFNPQKINIFREV